MYRNGFERWLLSLAMALQVSVSGQAADEQAVSVLQSVDLQAAVEGVRPFGIAAYVNDEPIACDEVQKISDELKLSRQGALDFLIEQKLLCLDFKKKGGKISAMHVEAQLETMAKEHFKGNRKLMQRVLAQQGQSLYGLKKDIRESMMLHAMQQGQFPSRFSISPKRIAAYYEAHASDFREEARYCLKQSGFKANETIEVPKVVREGDAKTSETMTKEVYLRRLSAQNMPSDIHKTLDTFHTEAIWYTESELDPKLVQALQTLSDGQQTSYLPIGDTWVTSMLVQKVEGRLKPLTEVQSAIEEQLLIVIGKERHRRYLQRLRAQASVIIF